DRRKFIVADTPGHEQYTRNMVTGASTADLAVILVDARKGILSQTRRHSYLARLLGISSIVLAVNKMDLVGFDQARFDAIVQEYDAFARSIGIGSFTAIPLSGLAGDNVARRSSRLSWYQGQSLLEHLETVAISTPEKAEEPFLMAVQWVNRPGQDFRGYAGRVASGRVRVGDEISVLPSGRSAKVGRIVTLDGDQAQAVAGQSVTLTLTREIDCSRGDIIASSDAAMAATSNLGAMLVWMSDEKLVPGRSYWVKIGAQTLPARIEAVHSVVDINEMGEQPGSTLGLNDIGRVSITLDRPIPAISYELNRKLGGFILVDRLTNATLAAGLVLSGGGDTRTGAREGSGSITWILGDGRADWAEQNRGRLQSIGRPVAIVDEKVIERFQPSSRATALELARQLAGLMSSAGVEVLLTLEATPGEAWPGRKVEAGAESQEGAEEWVI
ncbi:MAG: GTP-binding protein, partial [Sphingomonas sp.]|nr:GTP-binding protein [Sphingomonas sp.]